MKGPFERLKYDLRRLWECPLCKRKERSDGTVTSRFCTCPGKSPPGNQRTAMKLLEEAGHRAVPEIKYTPREESLPDTAPPSEAPSDIVSLPSSDPAPPETLPFGELPESA